MTEPLTRPLMRPGRRKKPPQPTPAEARHEAALARLEAAFARMANLRDGWLDGDGLAPTADFLATARFWAEALIKARFPVPSACPMHDGGVCFEWPGISAELAPNGMISAVCIGLEGIDTDQLPVLISWLQRAIPTGAAAAKMVGRTVVE